MSEAHSELRNTMRAYAGFQMATVLVVITNPDKFPLLLYILPLFAISIPSSIAYGGLARLTKVDELRNPARLSAISQLLTHIPALIALSLTIWTTSRIAALAFFLTAFLWTVIIVRLSIRSEK